MDRKKKIIIGASIGLVILIGIPIAHGKYQSNKAATQKQTPPSQKAPEVSVECPDKVEQDAATGFPIWIKGEIRKQITREDESWIVKNCKLAASVAEATPTENKTTKDTAKVSNNEQNTSTPADSSALSSTSSDSSLSSPAESPSTPAESSGSNSTGSAPASSTPAPVVETADPLVLKNLAVEFGPFDPETSRAGSFDFMYVDKPFFEFGDNGTEPTFTYHVLQGVDVFAVADGYVRSVTYQPSHNDYSIVVSTHPELHTWEIDYDHLINPTVSVGDRITAGKVLGNPALGQGGYGNGWFEIQVFGGTNAQGKLLNHCPFNFFDPSLIDTYKAKLRQLMQDFNDYNQLTDAYNFDNYTTSGHIGCLVSTMAEE